MPKKKESIYLETSVISAYFDFKQQDTERKKITRKFWKEVLPKYRVILSETVIEELQSAEESKTSKFLRLITGAERLEVTSREKNLAKKYIKAGIIRKTKFGDALHLAVTTLNQIDYLVSWNYEDIVGASQRKKISEFNKAHKLPLTQISTPNDFLIIK